MKHAAATKQLHPTHHQGAENGTNLQMGGDNKAKKKLERAIFLARKTKAIGRESEDN